MCGGRRGGEGCVKEGGGEVRGVWREKRGGGGV